MFFEGLDLEESGVNFEMEIFGERINTVRPVIAKAVASFDKSTIQKEAVEQVRAGVDFLDVNVGTEIEQEPFVMSWAVKSIQEVVDVPLCIDSPHPPTIQAGLEACKGRQDIIANSITLAPDRLGPFLELAKKHKCGLIALPLDEKSIPHTIEEKVGRARKLVEIITEAGIPKEKTYIDVLGEPICMEASSGRFMLETLASYKQELAEVKTIISLSAIGQGLPQRRLLNRSFIPLLLFLGLDAVFLDPLDRELRATIVATMAVLGDDAYCQRYLSAYRQGLLGAEGAER